MSVAIVLTVIAVLAFVWLGWAIRKRRRARTATGPTEALAPATDAGGDIAYRYYVDSSGLRALATDLNVDLPLRRQVVQSEVTTAAVPQGGPGASSQHEVTRELPEEINLAAFARRLRALEHAYVVDDLALLPADMVGEDLRTAKREQLRSAAQTNKVVVMRGHFQLASFPQEDEAAPIVLSLTHLSSEQLAPDTYPGVGDPAAALMPEGLTLEVGLVNSCERLVEGVAERFQRQEPFFGEVLAHSGSFAAETDTFTCIAWAVWGCPSPEPDLPGDVEVAY